MIHHHPTPTCDGNGACSPECSYRLVAAKFKADPDLAKRLAAEARPRVVTEPDPLPAKCQHLGEATGEQVKCGTCPGAVRIKLQTCAIHGKCSTVKPLPGVQCCVGCPDGPPVPLVVNQGAGGIGDSLMGACAIKGLSNLHDNRPIIYKISRRSKPFVRLFDLGNVQIGTQDFDGNKEVPTNPNPGDLQMNTGYGDELQSKGRHTRLERNCRNIGVVTPALPKLHSREALKSMGNDFLGAIAISPFSTATGREYPVRAWITVERLLREVGYRVVILDAPNKNFPGRHTRLKSEAVIGAPAPRVAGILLSSAMLVGNDSGLSHLGGIMGVPTLVLCGQVTGPEIYGFYGQNMHYLDGHLDCKGCWWQPPFNESCKPMCFNVATITPEEVVEAVQLIAGPPKPRPEDNQSPQGETSKAHARRQREGWFQWVKAPCLDVGCGIDYLLPGFPCRRWDQMYGDGDATKLEGVADESFATVYASHVLEHVHDPVDALRNWWRVLAPGGHLIVCVPHRDLYEGKLDLPSRWNGDHKTFWLPEIADELPHTRGLRQVLAQAGLGEMVVSFRILDDGHSFPDPMVHPVGEYSIEAILRKP